MSRNKSGATDTDLVVLSSNFPGPMTSSFFVATVTVTYFNSSGINNGYRYRNPAPTLIIRAAQLQNETAPEHFFIWPEKRFEKRLENLEQRSEKRSETWPKHFKPLSCRLKMFHRHFLVKVLHRPKYAQNKNIFSPRGSAGVATLINYCRDQNYSGSGKKVPGVDFRKMTDFIAGRALSGIDYRFQEFQAFLFWQKNYWNQSESYSFQ